MLIPYYKTRLEGDIAAEDEMLRRCKIVYGDDANKALDKLVVRNYMRALRDIRIVGLMLIGAEDVPTNNK